MSARISNMGCGGKLSAANPVGGYDIIYLGNSAVVDLDKVAGSRVDLESLVKSERRIDHLSS